MKRRSVCTNYSKSLATQQIPRKQDINKDFWFVNAGILPQTNYDKAVLFIGTYNLSSQDLLFVLFLGIKYLIHYIELFTFDSTPLLIECIEKQIKYIQLLLGKQKKSKKLLNYGLIMKLRYVFENLQGVEDSNYVCRQIYIDQLERFCIVFAIRLDNWIKNYRLQAYLIRYGYDQFRSSAIYNSFLIPNQRKYVEPLNGLNQKFIEKIELKCHCKILIGSESTDCYLVPEYITLEVIFDLYHGNYMGFIEMFGYVVKILNPTQYFAKSLRTILIEGSMLYNILTNVPIKKLKYLEKSVISGCPIAPFLSADSISKQFISILAMIRDQDENIKDVQKYEGSDDSCKTSELDFMINKSHKCHLTKAEENKLRDKIKNIDYSHRLLKYFKIKYDKEMAKINLQNQENKINIQLSSSDLKCQRSLSITLNSEDELEYRNENKVHDPIPEKLLVCETTNSYEVTEKPDIDREQINVNLNNEMDYLIENHFPSMDEYETVIDKDYLKSDQTYLKCNNHNINVSNIIAEEHINFNKPEIIDFNDLSPAEKFSVLLSESMNIYPNEVSWINHKLRLMMRCNTEQTIDDLKCPYLFEKRSIKDRLHKKSNYHSSNHFSKPKSYSRSYSNVPKLNSKVTMRITNQSWVSTEANSILLNSVEDETSSGDSEIDITDSNDLIKELPDIANYLRKLDKRLMETFIRRKLFRKRNWISFLEAGINFTYSRELEIFNICNAEHLYNKSVESASERIEYFKDPLAKNIYAMLIVLTKGHITEKQYQEMLDGVGIDFPVIRKINKSGSALPTYIGTLNNDKSKNPVKNLSQCLCKIAYDLMQLAHDYSQQIFYVLKTHISILDNMVRRIKDDEIKSAFNLLNITKDLLNLNMKSYIQTDGPNTSMFSLSEEVSLLHDIMFKRPCCSFKINKHLGMHVIYHSIQLVDRINAVEPFLKLPGDRRVRKIEKMCNCLITLRTRKHPVVPINEYFVDIFYDFAEGNHFGVLDLLKQMMVTQHKLLVIQDHRTLIVYPTGEMWAFRDTEWLKKCHNTYKAEKNEDILPEDG